MLIENLSINVTPGGVPVIIHISQYDIGLRTFVFSPYTSHGTFTPDAAAAATLEGTKPDGNVIIHNCEYNASTGEITYTVQEQLAAVSGKVWSKLTIRDTSGGVIGYAAIIWMVDMAGVEDGAIASDSDISALQEFIAEFGTINAYKAALDGALAAVGGPYVASTVSQMTDHTKVYVYTGSQSGYTAGHWYYWNGSAWTDGGVYQAAAVETDTTLTVADMAADAKATGDQITELKNDLGVFNFFNGMLSGFIPTSGTTYPTTNASYPNATYVIVDLLAGQSLKIAGFTSANTQGRARCIVNGEIVSSITNNTANYTTTVNFGTSINNGTITALKDIQVALMFLNGIATSGASATIDGYASACDMLFDNYDSIFSLTNSTNNLSNKLNDLTFDLTFYIYGGSRSISIDASGLQTVPFIFLKGVKYTFTNNSSSGRTLKLYKADDSTTVISGGIDVNASVTFTPTSNDYVGFQTWCQNTGSVTITTEYADAEVFDKLVDRIDTVINGNVPLGNIIENKYLTTSGGEANSSTRNVTDFIACDASWGTLSVYSDAMLGGDFCAFYDQNKTFISNFGYYAGLTQRPVPTNAKYVRFSINKTENSFRIVWWAKEICDKFNEVRFYCSFTEDDVEKGRITSSGAFYSHSGWRATPFIYVPFVNGGEINISSTLYENGGLAFYDINKNVIYGIDGNNASDYGLVSASTARKRVVTVPNGTYYIRASVYIYSTTTLSDLWLMDGVDFNNVLDVIENNNTSIYAMNEQESMVTNAGANYGHHSGGTSNTEKRFSMLVTTDVHNDRTALSRAVDYLNCMPCFDCGVTLGDIQGNTYSDNDGTWYTDIIKDAKRNWLTIIGNHEVGIGKSVATTGNQQQVYDKFIAPNIQYAGVSDDGKSYYYKDLSTYNIRLICLNAYDVDDNTTSDDEYIVPRYTEYYSQSQVDWFIDALSNTPSNYNVMVLTHSTPKASVKDTNIMFNDRTYSYSVEGTQNGIIADIVNAWQNGESLTASYPCSNTNLSTVNVDADFSSRGSGAFICFLTGHVHADVVGHVTAYPTQNVLAFSATSADRYQNANSDLPRADGTKAEDCITALAVDTTNKQIYINRIGSSVSKWFTVREPSVIAYE